jgi:two-component system, OmpR family, sensor histidine kinase PrrB
VGAVRSLRGRVALLATLAVGLVLLAVGATALATFANREIARVDEDLAERPPGPLVRGIEGILRDVPGPPRGGEPRGLPGPEQRELPGAEGGPFGPFGPPAFRPQGEYVRLLDRPGHVARSVDAPAGLPAPTQAGVRTADAGGASYRSLTRTIPGGALLEVGVDLSPTDERIDELRNRLILLGLLGVALVAGLSWWLAGLALRPLRSLRAAAGEVSSTRDLSSRLPAEGAPVEVAALTDSINAMLARLQGSAAETDEALEATRRFAGDAGHELRTPMTALRADIGTLRRNPDLPPDQRAAALEHAEHEVERATRLLELLQTLARGDSGTALPRETLDLAELAESAIEAARARHPSVAWRLDAPEGELELRGWPDGLRALLDNLLDNAARYGRPGGSVRATLERDGEGATITVDDDGPGVEPPERERIFERFARGQASRDGGLGLGLALVRQQARLHGGEASVGESPLGGARFRVALNA